MIKNKGNEMIQNIEDKMSLYLDSKTLVLDNAELEVLSDSLSVIKGLISVSKYLSKRKLLLFLKGL